MEPSLPRTVHDYGLALRRSLWLVVMLVVIGAIAGYAISSSGSTVSASTVRLDDRTPLAVSLGLPAQVIDVATPTVVKGRFEDDASQLVANLPDDVEYSLVADDVRRTVEVRVRSDSSSESQELSEALAMSILDRLRSEERSRIEAAKDLHRDRVAQLDDLVDNMTDDAGRATLLVEQSGHLDELGALDRLEAGLESSGALIERSSEDSSSSSMVNLLAGALAGLFVSLAVVYARLISDKSIRRSIDLETSTGSSRVATLGAESDASLGSLIPLSAVMLSEAQPGSRFLVVAIDDATHAHAVADGLKQASLSLDASKSLEIVAASEPANAGSGMVNDALQSTGTILVASYGRTTGLDARAAAHVLDTVGAELVGGVLVGVPRRELWWASSSGSYARQSIS